MNNALHALLEGLVDYAGLFPPAGLEMWPAVESYVAYRESDDRWMLSRFVVPAARAEELAAVAPSDAAPLELSVLARPDHLDADGAVPQAGCFEIRLPDELVARDEAAAIDAWTRKASATLASTNGTDRPLFLEAGTLAAADTVVAGIATARARGVAAGFKIRTGGLEPAAFPTSADLAAAVIACRDAGVPFKATAGLHHPLPHHDAAVGARMHGFLNLFGGAALALAHGLDADRLAEILDDEERASWRLDDRLAWRELSASASEVRRARARLATSFGSCSFDEPREDLRALGLWPSARA